MANELDWLAAQTFAHNLGHGPTVGDIKHHVLPDDHVQLVIGGPPCQGFSVAGHMDPDDPRSQHVWYFLAVVNRVQPQCFVMENVKSLAVNQRFADLVAELREAAETLGYRTTLCVLNASHFGVPQNRERMFLIGHRGVAPLFPRRRRVMRNRMCGQLGEAAALRAPRERHSLYGAGHARRSSCASPFAVRRSPECSSTGRAESCA